MRGGQGRARAGLCSLGRRRLPAVAGGRWALRTGGSAGSAWGWAGAWRRRSAPCGSCTRTGGTTERRSVREDTGKAPPRPLTEPRVCTWAVGVSCVGAGVCVRHASAAPRLASLCRLVPFTDLAPPDAMMPAADTRELSAARLRAWHPPTSQDPASGPCRPPGRSRTQVRADQGPKAGHSPQALCFVP